MISKDTICDFIIPIDDFHGRGGASVARLQNEAI